MAILDAAAFPHILSAILSFSAWGTLNTLRFTSKSVRAAVDMLQCEHLVLTQSKLDNTVLDVRAPGGVRIAALKTCSPQSWAQLPLHPHTALVEKTRILDIVGYVSPECNLMLLAPHFHNLDTLRMPTDPKDGGYTPYFPIPSNTLVLFTNDDACPKPYVPKLGGYLDDFDDEEDTVVPDGVSGSIPAGVTKIIGNMKGTDIPIADVHPAIMDPPESVTDIVIVVLQYRKGWRHGRIQEGLMGEEIVVMDTAELILANQSVNFTIVGLDEVRARYPVHFRKSLAERMRVYNVKGIDEDGDNVIHCNPFGPGPRHVARTKYRPEKEAWIAAKLAKVTFQSMTEYLQANGRGDRKGDIDCVEHL